VFIIEDHLFMNRVSNLFFYWAFALTLEREEKYDEALNYYKKLKTLYLNNSGKYIFDRWADNSVETIDGKIYKLTFLLNE